MPQRTRPLLHYQMLVTDSPQNTTLTKGSSCGPYPNVNTHRHTDTLYHVIIHTSQPNRRPTLTSLPSTVPSLPAAINHYSGHASF